MSNRIFGSALIVAGLSCAAAVPVHADPVSPASPGVSQVSPEPAERLEGVSALAPSANAAPKTLNDADLNNCRGSGGLVVGNQTLNAISSGDSTITSYTAGAVSISDQALSNFNGLGNITINTGALSQLQSAMNITVNVNP